MTAATLSDIYSCVTSGIGALKGPLHGGANEDVIKMLLEVGTADKAVERVHEMLAKKIKIPGFGHRVYRTDDPRATHLRVMSEDLGKSTGHEDLYLMSKPHGRDCDAARRSSTRTSISIRRPPTIRSVFRSICSHRFSP